MSLVYREYEDIYRNSRCPRCSGFLYDSRLRYWKYHKNFEGVLHCLNCGRDWRIVKRRDGYVLELFSFRVLVDAPASDRIFSLFKEA